MSDDKVVKAETGMVRSKFERTLAKMEGSQDTVLVLDTSGSMQEHGATGERRIDALRSVVYGIRSRGTAFRQLIFNTDSEWSDIITEPTGGTNLAEAFDACRAAGAKHVILVSDGEPDDPTAALHAAKQLGCPIDVFYVGPEGHASAQDFMKSLAKTTGASVGSVSFAELESKIAGVLSQNAGEDEAPQAARAMPSA